MARQPSGPAGMFPAFFSAMPLAMRLNRRMKSSMCLLPGLIGGGLSLCTRSAVSTYLRMYSLSVMPHSRDTGNIIVKHAVLARKWA